MMMLRDGKARLNYFFFTIKHLFTKEKHDTDVKTYCEKPFWEQLYIFFKIVYIEGLAHKIIYPMEQMAIIELSNEINCETNLKIITQPPDLLKMVLILITCRSLFDNIY